MMGAIELLYLGHLSLGGRSVQILVLLGRCLIFCKLVLGHIGGIQGWCDIRVLALER